MKKPVITIVTTGLSEFRFFPGQAGTLSFLTVITCG